MAHHPFPLGQTGHGCTLGHTGAASPALGTDRSRATPATHCPLLANRVPSHPATPKSPQCPPSAKSHHPSATLGNLGTVRPAAAALVRYLVMWEVAAEGTFHSLFNVFWQSLRRQAGPEAGQRGLLCWGLGERCVAGGKFLFGYVRLPELAGQLLLAYLWSSKLYCYTALLVKADTKMTELLEDGNKLVRAKDYKLAKYTE